MPTNMHNETPGKSWRQRLEEPSEELPVGFQQEAAWDALHKRLGKRRSRAAFYWRSAAAVLLIVLAGTWWLEPANDRTTAVVPHKPNNATEKARAAAKVSSDTMVITVTDTRLSARAEPVIVTTPHVTKNADKPVVTTQPEMVTAVSNVDGQTKEPASAPLVAVVPVSKDSSAVVQSARQNIRRPVRVVHINELGEATTGPVDVAQTGAVHIFPFSFGNQGLYQLPTPPPGAKPLLTLPPKSIN